MKKSNGFYINNRTKEGNKLYRNKVEIPSMVFFNPEDKKIKTWRDMKDRILYKIQIGEEIFGKPMTDKELNQFSKIAFECFKSLDKIHPE